MSTLEIILIITGIIFMAGSFFITGKLSDSDLQELKKMSEDQIKEVIRTNVSSATTTLEENLNDKISECLEEMDRKTDRETTARITNIAEYSDSVLQSINKSHDEVMFMYSMLNEKHKNVSEMTKKLVALEESLKSLDETVSRKLVELKEQSPENTPIYFESPDEILEKMEEVSEPNSFAADMNIHFEAAEKKDKRNDNLEILNMHDLGMSEVDIAKKLGRGLGEVKFVLGLYKENT